MTKIVFIGETPDVQDYDIVKVSGDTIQQGDIVYFAREDDDSVVINVLHHDEIMTFTGKAYCVEGEKLSEFTILTQITLITPFRNMNKEEMWVQ